MRLLMAIFAGLLIVSCSSTNNIPEGKNKPEDFFHIQKPENNNGRWVVILPGTSGLKIFDDEKHYFNLANKLNKEGFTVILVDYKPAYKTSGRDTKETTGEKILWVTEQAINWALENNHINRNQKGSVVGWSLAGEGMILLANNSSKAQQLNIQSLAMYYPSNQAKIELISNLPILIQSGGLDQITPKSEIEKFYKKSNSTSVIFYENAHHGFDVMSLKEGTTMRFPPVVGEKYVFQYNERAAEESINELISFLN